MKLIEADKVNQAIKDYWKAYVDRMPTPYSTEEFEKFANHAAMCFEHRDELLKAIDELPSIQPNTTTHDSIPTETGKNDGDGTSGDCISRQQAIDTLRKMQTYKLFEGDDMILIDKAQVQTELMMLPPAQPEHKGTRLSTVCLMCKKPAVTFNTEDDIPYTNYSYCEDCLRKGLKLLREQKKNLQVQPERKDAVEKAVAVEAISDELMSRFDISATYAYEVAEKAMNRIEAMAKELERGEQE